MKPIVRCIVAAASLLLAACGPSEPGASPKAASVAFDESAAPAPADPVLALGQQVYRGDCYNCHNLGKKGAPRIADRTAWTPRLGQGVDTLIRHAIEGYLGPAGDEMPARGGNDALTDSEVTAAVRYLISQVQ